LCIFIYRQSPKPQINNVETFKALQQ